MNSKIKKNGNLPAQGEPVSGGQPRPPIVAVMGHIDHGKTTLLDYIRQANVASREAGGITQSIGAYEIEVQPKGEPKSRESESNQGIPRQARDDFSAKSRKITFIDTPGHEAFSRMREHGAKAADLAVLVVAADDGVKPQTKEALKAIRQAQLPFVVVITKIDKNNADIERVKNDLRDNEVLLEGEGGDISWQAVSAKKGEGVEELLDLILLVAEVADLKYDPAAPANGVILTARLDSRRGLTVSGILRDGVLKRGQAAATASASGKIKILENFLGENSAELVPSAPALILGFDKLPAVGEVFYAGENSDDLKNLLAAEKNTPAVPSFENDPGGLKLILRADEAGSLEALAGLIKKISLTLPLAILDAAVGQINESDVKTAATSNAVIVGFRVKTDKPAENVIKAQEVRVVSSDIIYDLEKSLREINQAAGLAKSDVFEVVAVFGERKGNEQIIGGRAVKGIIKNQADFEIFSGSEKIGSGRILNLQSQKQDVAKIESGQEAGMLVETDIAVEAGQELVF